MTKFYAVVLIYNTKVENSITYKNIKNTKLSNINILILDNSTKNLNNEDYCKKNNIEYISMNGNKGLSYPYNQALDYLINKKKVSLSDYIIWLDDDTEINKEYFDTLEKEIKSNKDIDIFAPVIYGQDSVIYSPNEARFIKNKLVNSRDEVFNIKKYNAINSCLCVKLETYKDYRYDEILFLDQTDQNFFDDMRNLNKSFKTIDVDIKQNFSQRGKKLDGKKMIVRHELRVKDIMRYGRKSLIDSIKSLIKACGLSLQLGIKCKYPFLTIKCGFISILYFFNNIKNLILRRVE